MSIDKNHSEQLRKYLNGEMSPKEANVFERKTLDDPFTQEAIEGLEGQNVDQAFSTIAELQKQVAGKSNKGLGWMRIAAVVALLFVSAFALWFTVNQTENSSELAIQEQPIPTSPIDSITSETPIVENEEMIAEAAIIEDTSTKKFKDDGVRVADTNELIAEDDQLKEVEPVMTLAEADVSAEEILEIDDTPETALKGKVAGVQITKASSSVAETTVIDDSALNAADVITQTIVAQENTAETKPSYSNDDTSKRIVIRGKTSLAKSTNSGNMTVTGKVTDDTGEPLPGVNVIIKGTTTGTQTDLDGNYLLPKFDGMTLIYSFVGFESQEVEVGARTSIDVSMGGATELQEVVVTAIGLESDKRVLGYSVNEEETQSEAKPEMGNRKYNKYLKENLQYPTEAINNEVEGTVVLELTISPAGEIIDVDIKKGLGFGCDEEAIRLVKEGPEWNAAKNDGNLVEGKVKVRVKFKL